MSPSKYTIFTVTNDLATDQRMDRICTTLHENGIKILLIGRSGKTTDEIERAYEIHHLNIHFKKGPFFYLEYNLRLLLFLLKIPASMIVAVDLDTVIGVRIATWMKRVKMGFDAHEYFVYSPELEGRQWRQKIWILVEKIFLRNIELAYTVNHYLAKTFQNRYGFNFSVIRNLPIKRDKSVPKGLPQSEPIILIYQGVMNVGRAVDLYIDALADLPNCELWLLGDGDIYDQLKQYGQQKKYRDRIKFFGKISPDRLKNITDKAHIGLNMLYPESKNYYYSLANKFFDYMASGCPSINMDFPIYRSYIEKYEIGVMVENYDKKSFVKAVQLITNNPEYYRNLSKNATEAFQQLNWENESELLTPLFEN